MVTPRQRVFLAEYEKTSNIYQSALKAGYSEVYAQKQGKILLTNAMKAKTKGVLDILENKPVSKQEAKRLMSDIVGLSREEMMDAVKRIALNDRDYASALKVLSPLLAQHEITLLKEENTQINVPVLNITVRENGLTEPPIQIEAQ